MPLKASDVQTSPETPLYTCPVNFTHSTADLISQTEINITIAEQVVADAFGKGSLMYRVAKCESEFDSDAVGDGHLICKATGLPVRSRGIWQINDCAHPEVSDEQAFDPVWSTEWAKKREWRAESEWKNCFNKSM